VKYIQEINKKLEGKIKATEGKGGASLAIPSSITLFFIRAASCRNCLLINTSASFLPDVSGRVCGHGSDRSIYLLILDHHYMYGYSKVKTYYELCMAIQSKHIICTYFGSAAMYLVFWKVFHLVGILLIFIFHTTFCTTPPSMVP
jgi:hypothetical protein